MGGAELGPALAQLWAGVGVAGARHWEADALAPARAWRWAVGGAELGPALAQLWAGVGVAGQAAIVEQAQRWLPVWSPGLVQASAAGLARAQVLGLWVPVWEWQPWMQGISFTLLVQNLLRKIFWLGNNDNEG